MTLTELKLEAENLARPAAELIHAEQGRLVVGYWGGSRGVIASKSGSARHIVSVSCAALPCESPTDQRWMSVYVDGDPGPPITVLCEVPTSTAAMRGAVELSASSLKSYPPLTAVFAFGSPAVERWLLTLGWDRRDEYNENFPDAVGAKYEAWWREHVPLFRSTPPACTLGGWHLEWPDGDWESRCIETLVLTTYWDSEPWYEIWRNGSGLVGVARIT